MADLSTLGWQSRWLLRLAANTSVFVALAGCGQLLDLPSDPRLADDSLAGAGVGGASSGVHTDEHGSSLEPWREPVTSAESSGPGLPTDGLTDAGAGATGGSNTVGADAGEGLPNGPAPDAATPPLEGEPELGCGVGESAGPDGRCYVIVDTLLSWVDARSSCLARGAGWDLAAVRSDAVALVMADLVVTQAWIGASDADEEGTWLWVNEGVPFWSGTGTTGNVLNGEYENWNSDEPNGRGASDCARLFRPASAPLSSIPTWADLECFELLPAVCEGPAR